MHLSMILLALAAACSSATPAKAADAFTEAVQASYAPYRAALSRTNGKSQPEAVQAVGQARQAWAELLARHGAALPAPYDRDGAAPATLAEVSRLFEEASKQVQDGRLAPAHETLEGVRDLLAELRRRNGVVVFSDHMNAYHEQMEHVLMEGPRLLADAAGAQQLLAHAGALDYLARRLRTQAPEALRGNADFTGLQHAVEEATTALSQALMRQDAAAARDALGKLKRPYSQLFVKFG